MPPSFDVDYVTSCKHRSRLNGNTNQDTCGSWLSQIGERVAIVADGHGEDGDKVSQAAKDGLMVSFAQARGKYGDNIDEVAKHTVYLVSEHIKCSLPKEVVRESGSTLVIMIIKGDTATFAYLGDSSYTLYYPEGCICNDVTLHKPYNLIEYERICNANGYVSDEDKPTARLCGRLAMSRSLGNTFLNGISSIPQVDTFNIRNVNAIVLRTNGTDSVNIHKIMYNMHPSTTAKQAAQQIINETDGSDDATVVVFKRITW